MNKRQARVVALHASMLQVEALLSAEYLEAFEADDRARVRAELEAISDRLYDRVVMLDPDHETTSPVFNAVNGRAQSRG